jgi:xanthine dehydrogenase accessory factor
MAVREDGLIAGSVSGGCVEGAVAEATLRSLETGVGEWLCFEGQEPEDLWKIGLSCGGSTRVLVLPGGYSQTVQEAMRRARASEEFAVVSDGVSMALWPCAEFLLGEEAAALGQEAVAAQQTLVRDGWAAIANVKRPEMLVVGASHITVPLVAFARELGFRTTLIEPRSALALNERFPVAPDHLEAVWPQDFLAGQDLKGMYAVVLTHDAKIDDPALRILIRSEVAYIGALGSRTTHTQRRARLLAEGFSEAEVDRIRGPVGLPIGAKTPAEIALSIVAEIVQVRRGKP